jgi:hypothetical protein
MSEEVQEFQLDLKEQIVLLKAKKGDRKIIIREVRGSDRDKYLDDLNSRISEADESGKSKIKKFEGMKSFLLSVSCWELGKDGTEVQLTQKEIDTFPARVQDKLFDISQKLSELDKTKTEEPASKNDSPASGSTGSGSPIV